MRNSPWFASGFSTAAGVIVEKSVAPLTTLTGTGNPTQYRLRGYSVSGSTALAISTNPIKLRLGPSSAGPFTSHRIANEPGIGMIGATRLQGIEAGYIAIQTTVVHANGGLTVMIWGD